MGEFEIRPECLIRFDNPRTYMAGQMATDQRFDALQIEQHTESVASGHEAALVAR